MIRYVNLDDEGRITGDGRVRTLEEFELVKAYHGNVEIVPDNAPEIVFDAKYDKKDKRVVEPPRKPKEPVVPDDLPVPQPEPSVRDFLAAYAAEKAGKPAQMEALMKKWLK